LEFISEIDKYRGGRRHKCDKTDLGRYNPVAADLYVEMNGTLDFPSLPEKMNRTQSGNKAHKMDGQH
jgi:hypothetical protein